MALITSAASGNFNAGATWTGGIVPGVGDEARASTGHTITITANATCTEISNAGTGTFVLNSGVTLTANVTPKGNGAVHCLTFSSASPAVSYVAGNVIGSSTQNNTYGIVASGTGALNITGTVTGGSGTGAGAVNNTSSGIINITGNVTGGPFSGNSFGAQNASTGTITITGNVTGGASTGCIGANNSSTGILTIIGNVTAAAVAGVNNASTGTLTITGDVTASTSANGVISTNASSIVRVSGSFIYASNGLVAVNTPKLILLNPPTAAKTRYALNGTSTFVDMFTADNTGLAPAVGDVRAGVVYGSATGVLSVPAANSVAFGVPVDNTIGTAVLDPAAVATAVWGAATRTLTSASGPTAADNATAVWSAATRTITGGVVTTLTNAPNVPTPSAIADEVWNRQASAITTTNSIGERVKNTATTAILGNLLAQSNS